MTNQELAQQLTDALNELGELPVALKHAIIANNAIIKILTVRAELLRNDMVQAKKDD